MREIDAEDVGRKLLDLINEEHPIEEDIGILNAEGKLLGVLITPDAYQFFLHKVEEEEDRADLASIREFDNSGERNQ